MNHIKNQEVIQFEYLKYDSNQTEIRQIEPLAIKESRERWYVIGNNFPYNNGLRAFAFQNEFLTHVSKISDSSLLAHNQKLVFVSVKNYPLKNIGL